jgi:hypothetical protein
MKKSVPFLAVLLIVAVVRVVVCTSRRRLLFGGRVPRLMALAGYVGWVWSTMRRRRAPPSNARSK